MLEKIIIFIAEYLIEALYINFERISLSLATTRIRNVKIFGSDVHRRVFRKVLGTRAHPHDDEKSATRMLKRDAALMTFFHRTLRGDHSSWIMCRKRAANR